MGLKIRAIVSSIRLLLERFLLRKDIKGLNPRIALGKSSTIRIEKGGAILFGGQFVTRKNVDITIGNKGRLIVGDKVFLNSNCVVSVHDRVQIGDRVQFGPGCLIFDNDHDYKQPIEQRATSFKTSPITIGDNTWIGGGTIILRGTNIGENCVIGAGSVIKRDIPSNTIYVQKRTETIIKKED